MNRHITLARVCVLATQSCLTLCDPTDGGPPSFSVYGTLQARTLEWIAILFSRGTSQPRIKCWSPTLQAGSLLSELQGSPERIRSTGIQAHAPKETGALTQHLRPLSHATTSTIIS